MFKLFGRKNKNLPNAIAFVDYEHWFISMEKLYHSKPNIDAWFEDLKAKCNIKEVIFFANLSKFKDKEEEIRRIRRFTNKIIDTVNPDIHYEKDYTDFIILDNIYQEAISAKDVDLFIIFSGDGHFSSVTAFLKNFAHKEVGIYGVKGATSKILTAAANWAIEVPLQSERFAPFYDKIFKQLEYIEAKTTLKAAYLKTINHVAQNMRKPVSTVQSAMDELIKLGYVTVRSEVNARTKRNESIIYANWAKVKKDKFWPAEKS